MSSSLDKRTATVELFKAGNSRKDICKSLKVNRILAWRTLKCFEETGDIQNSPGQGHPRTARTPKLVYPTGKWSGGILRNTSRFWLKSQECRMRPCQLYSERAWRCLHWSMLRNTKFLFKVLINDCKDPRFFFPACRIARYRISFSIMRSNLMLNTTLTSKTIEFGRGMGMKHPCGAKETMCHLDQCWSEQPLQSPVEVPSFLLTMLGVKLNQQNYRDDILVGVLIVALGSKALQKTSLVFSAELCTFTWSQKKLRSGFPRMPSTSFLKRNGLHPPPIWILLIFGSGHTLRARSRPLTIKVCKPWRWNCRRSGPKSPRK